MTRSTEIPTLFLLLLPLLLAASALPLQGQGVFNDWSQGGGVVTNMEENTVKESDYAAEGIFSDWSSVMSDYEKYDGDRDIDRKAGEKTASFREQFLNGTRLQLPCIPDENGADLFLLTTQGIHIYLALDQPVYHQTPDDTIIKWIRYYALEKRNYTRRMFRRFESWKPFIDECFRAEGVPAELSELCLIESGCTYDPVSPAGAAGMWQIMPETGRSYGMSVGPSRDDRFDPVLSTKTAARILKANKARVGDWTLAAAAYNCGAGRVQREMKSGRPTWEHMKGTLPRETSGYVPALIAIHYVWTYRNRLALD